jgi:hypothetical protein
MRSVFSGISLSILSDPVCFLLLLCSVASISFACLKRWSNARAGPVLKVGKGSV